MSLREVLVVGNGELDLLKSFDADGHLAISLYLDLSTPERRNQALRRVIRRLEPLLENGDSGIADKLGSLQEDLEMIRLYLKTSGSRRSPYVAIFVCAPQLFWRAYQLEAPVPELLEVGPRFHVNPLEEVASDRGEAAGLLVRKRNSGRDLPLHTPCASL